MLNKILYNAIRAVRFLKSKTVDFANKSKCECEENVRFTQTSKVFNLLNDPSKIKIMKKTTVEGELFVFKYGGRIKIGCNSYIGHGSRIWSGEKIVIGDNVLVSHNVNIVDTNAHEINSVERKIGYHNLQRHGHPSDKGSIQTSPIIINDNVWISFNATILKGVTIGEGAIVGANSVVTKNIPPYTLVAGNPAKSIKIVL